MISTFKIDVFRDGNQVGVCLGPDTAEGFSGFGPDLPAALEHLVRDLRSEPGEYETPERAQLRQKVRRKLEIGGRIHLITEANTDSR